MEISPFYLEQYKNPQGAYAEVRNEPLRLLERADDVRFEICRSNEATPLVPVIVVNEEDLLIGSKAGIRMLGYMNQEALQKTIQTRDLYFWSGIRQAVWRKGEVDGSMFVLRALYTTAQQDSLLATVSAVGRSDTLNGAYSYFGEPSGTME